jgi:fumarate reductase subunit D
LLFDAGLIAGPVWMTLVGLGLYLAYVPYNCVLFDRLIALLRSPGTAVFTLNLADTVGYTGSVSFILFKHFGRNDLSRFEFFHWMCYVSAVLCTVCFAWSLLHFLRSAPRTE